MMKITKIQVVDWQFGFFDLDLLGWCLMQDPREPHYSVNAFIFENYDDGSWKIV